MILIKRYLLIFFIFSLIYAEGEEKIFKAKICNQDSIKVENLNNKISELESKIEDQKNINNQTLTCISTQIDAATYNITILSIGIAVALLLLGVYVTFIERKIVKINNHNENLFEKTEKIKAEVEKINDDIKNDIYNLFLKIKREETVHILNRLLKIPKDISNFSNSLLSRELIQSDFFVLKEAFLKVKDIPKKKGILGLDYKEEYLLIFFQHFLDLCMKDEQIHPNIKLFYETGIKCSFENDIIKSTNDFIKAIIDLGIYNMDEDINLFFEALAISDYKNMDKLYFTIFKNIYKREDQFKFYNIISDQNLLIICKINYGKHLVEKYSKENLSETEKRIIEDINNLNKKAI